MHVIFSYRFGVLPLMATLLTGLKNLYIYFLRQMTDFHEI